jgi:hypothetical protein
VKWSKEQTIELITMYRRVGKDGINDIARYFNRSKEAVISKLSFEGEYVSDRKKSVYTGEKPKTKEQLVKELEHITNLDLNTLEKANKLVIINLIRKFNEK